MKWICKLLWHKWQYDGNDDMYCSHCGLMVDKFSLLGRSKPRGR